MRLKAVRPIPADPRYAPPTRGPCIGSLGGGTSLRPQRPGDALPGLIAARPRWVRLRQNRRDHLTSTLAERYGPWAVIAGGSDGTGRAFAHELAAAGLNLVLVARREAPLAALAAELSAAFGVECLPVALDLMAPDAAERLAEAVGTREVGLYVSNAGSDPNGAKFLDKGIAAWRDLVALNVLTPLAAVHHFARQMRDRGRGGVLLVGSGACYGGGPSMATYSGAKAFLQRFAEGLWAELEPHGVDVLFFALSRTDTPAFHRLQQQLGTATPAGLADPADVARIGLARLPHGPVADWGSGDDEPGMAGISPAARRDRVRMIAAASAAIFGKR